MASSSHSGRGRSASARLARRGARLPRAVTTRSAWVAVSALTTPSAFVAVPGLTGGRTLRTVVVVVLGQRLVALLEAPGAILEAPAFRTGGLGLLAGATGGAFGLLGLRLGAVGLRLLPARGLAVLLGQLRAAALLAALGGGAPRTGHGQSRDHQEQDHDGDHDDDGGVHGGLPLLDGLGSRLPAPPLDSSPCPTRSP